MVKMVVQRWQRQEATDAETMLDAGLAMAWSLDEVEKTVSPRDLWYDGSSLCVPPGEQ